MLKKTLTDKHKHSVKRENVRICVLVWKYFIDKHFLLPQILYNSFLDFIPMFKDCVSISFQAVSTIVPPIWFVVKGCAVLVIRGIIIADARAGWSISSFINISCHHLGAAVAPTSIICVAPKVFLSSGVTFINTWFAITWLESWLIVELIKSCYLVIFFLGEQ